MISQQKTRVIGRTAYLIQAGAAEQVITNGEIGHSGPGPDEASLAGRLAAAQRTLAVLPLDDEVRARFGRRLTAIGDAIKAPGADPARCARRLDLLLADLPGPNPAKVPPGA